MTGLIYSVPAERLRDFVSVYYCFAVGGGSLVDHERAALAQVRFLFNGTATLQLPGMPDGTPISSDCVIGPTSAAMRFNIDGPFKMCGFGLLPAGWAMLTSRCASLYLDRVMPLATFFPELDECARQIRTAQTVDEFRDLLDQQLLEVFANPDPEILAFTKLIDSWLASEKSPEVSTLQDMTPLSSRQLTRKVNQYYGMPPKYLARKYRALKAARLLPAASADEKARIADSFYDQSHMIREIRHFTGTTPSKLRRGEGEVAAMIDARAKLDGVVTPLATRT